MGNLKNIEGFFIHHNRLLFLPEWISKFKHLEILDVGFNQIRIFPHLSKLEALYEVDLQENNVEQIPIELLEKQGIQRVFLSGNPFILKKTEIEDFQKLIDELAKKNIRVFF